METLQRDLQSFAASFDVSFLAGPTAEKPFGAGRWRQRQQFDDFLRGEIAFGDFFRGNVGANSLNIDAKMAVARESEERQTVGMGNVELNIG